MRPQGTRHWNNETSADQVIVDFASFSGVVEGNLYSVDIQWHNQSVGDRIVIYANTSNSGTKVLDFLIPTTAGSFAVPLPAVGKRFEKGLYFNPNIADPTAGKLKVNIGYDFRT